MSGDNDKLLESHEDRLQRLEHSMSQVHISLLPTLARLEARFEEGISAVRDDLVELKVGLHEVKKAAAEDTTRDYARDHSIKSLQTINDERKKLFWGVFKWAGGIVAGILVAAAILVLGLRP
jgi:hypothetical protein